MRIGIDSKWLWAAAFTALSALDLYLTWLLVEHSAGCVYEANPLAAWVLEQHGWLGLAGYKFASMLVVLVLGIIVACFRPRLGRWLFAGSTGTLAIVAGYSLLLWTTPAWAGSELHSLYELREETESLEQQRLDLQLFSRTSARLSRGLLEGRLSLVDAAQTLEQQLAGLSYDPLRYLRTRYPDLSDEARLSMSLVRGAAAALRDHPRDARPHLRRLAQEFEARYHTFLPALPNLEAFGAAFDEESGNVPPATEE